MTQELIHVHIGTFIGNYPIRKRITSGPMAGMIELQQDRDTIAWVHQKWCREIGDNGDFQKSPITTASVQDTDWRKFLRDHWLQNKNMLNPNYADEFMKVFMAAQQVRKAKQHKDVAKVQPSPCAQSFRTEEKKKEEKPAKLYPDEIIKGKRGTWVQLTLF